LFALEDKKIPPGRKLRGGKCENKMKKSAAAAGTAALAAAATTTSTTDRFVRTD